MATVKERKYRKAVQTLLSQYATFGAGMGDIERQLIFDTQHDHYQMVNVGWQDQQRIYGCAMHLDIKDGKIWIQHNGTEIELDDELTALGVPKNDIVVGFISPARRHLTEFATN